MFKVFISYPSPNRNEAWQLDCDLQLAGAHTWIDRAAIQQNDDRPDPAQKTEYFRAKLSEGLKSVNAFILIVSRHTAQSEWVRMEYKIATERNLQIYAFVVDSDHQFDLSRLPESHLLSQPNYEDRFHHMCRISRLRLPVHALGSLTGHWDYQSSERNAADGFVVLVQRAQELIGRVDYQTANSGMIYGIKYGSMIRFIWANTLENGTGYLRVAGDGSQLKGAYIRSGSCEEIPWILRRNS